MTTPAVEAIAASLAPKATYGGGAVAVFGGLTSHDVVALAGLFVACLGALANWYYKHRADRRMAREHELRMRRLELGQRSGTDLGQLGEDE